MQNIYVDSSDLTILLGNKFYLIDKTAYNYEEGTLYTPGYYVIYENELYKVQTKTSKSPAEEPSAYLKQSSIDDVTTVASSDDIQELKNEIQGSGDETEKDFTELKDSIQELDTNLQELDTEVTQELNTIKEQYLKIDDFSTTLQGSSIDASQIKGILNLSNIPASALPVVKTVTGVEDMYTLTTNDVQVGDVGLSLDDVIPVKSITFGGLTYRARSTNAIYRWNQIGAIEYMTVAELNEMNNYKRAYLNKPLVLLLDERAVKKFRLQTVYENVAQISNLKKLFKSNLSTISRVVDHALDVNMRDILISKTRQMIKNKTLTDINVIKLLEKKLQHDLADTV